jgi:hypothetical protein
MSTAILTQELENIPAPEYTPEPGYVPKRHVYLGLRIQVTLRDQQGTPLCIYFDFRDQVLSFISGFALFLQRGQIVRFECDAMGMHGWIRGRGLEVRDQHGKRVMPTHGHPAFDALLASLEVPDGLTEELHAWETYTAHNPYWYLQKTRQRYLQARALSHLGYKFPSPQSNRE